MVVEDEYDLQGIMEEALAESGFATDILSSGEEALTLFRGGLKNYRALVADVGLMAGPALAKGTMTTAAKDKQATVAKSHHMQRHAAYRGERYRNASATLTSDQYRRPVGPIGAAGAVVGGAVATAGAIATAPFRTFDNGYNDYYGYGYGGRDWKTYAARNGLACTPGTMVRGGDGLLHPCQ
jgi:hypothetical protein